MAREFIIFVGLCHITPLRCRFDCRVINKGKNNSHPKVRTSRLKILNGTELRAVISALEHTKVYVPYRRDFLVGT